MGDKEILNFIGQATDVVRSQSTEMMRIKGKSLLWLADKIEETDKEEKDAD